MKTTFLQITLMLSAFSVFSQNYSNGLFLVHEGNFGMPSGDISFYDNESDSLYLDIYQTANPTEEAFDVLQDFEIFNSSAYFLTKSAANEKIVITAAEDFSFIADVDLNTAGPQSITMISESKAYISCANAPNLRILDLEENIINGSVGSSVGTFGSQDFISVHGTKAYIFMGDKLGVIDTELDSAYNDILLPNAESSCAGMLIEGQKLFVLSNSGWSGDEAHLFRIDLETDEVELNLDLSGLGKARLLQSDGENLYFMILGEVYKMGIDEDIAPTESFASSSFVDTWGDLAYGKSFLVNASSQEIYIGSAEEFSGESSYEILDLSDGTSLDTDIVSGGIILNQFLIRNEALDVEELASVRVSIYPIPANDYLVIEIEGNEQKEISLIDLNGNTIRSMKSSDPRIRWNLDEVSAGIYFVRVKTKSSLSTKRVLIYN